MFCLAGVNAGRAGVTLAEWTLWSGFDLPFPLPVRVALSAAWAVALGAAAWGLWVRRHWARRGALVLIPLYQLYELGWRLAFVRSDYQRGRLPFLLAMAVAVTLVAAFILTRKSVVHAFEAGGTRTETAYDKQSED